MAAIASPVLLYCTTTSSKPFSTAPFPKLQKLSLPTTATIIWWIPQPKRNRPTFLTTTVSGAVLSHGTRVGGWPPTHRDSLDFSPNVDPCRGWQVVFVRRTKVSECVFHVGIIRLIETTSTMDPAGRERRVASSFSTRKARDIWTRYSSIEKFLGCYCLLSDRARHTREGVNGPVSLSHHHYN